TTPDAVVSTTPILVIQWALLNERSVRKNDFIKRAVLKTLSPTNGEHIRIEVVATHDFFDIVAPLQIDRKAARHTEVISESSRHEYTFLVPSRLSNLDEAKIRNGIPV